MPHVASAAHTVSTQPAASAVPRRRASSLAGADSLSPSLLSAGVLAVPAAHNTGPVAGSDCTLPAEFLSPSLAAIQRVGAAGFAGAAPSPGSRPAADICPRFPAETARPESARRTPPPCPVSVREPGGALRWPILARDIPLCERIRGPRVEGGQGRSDLEVERAATWFAIACVVLIGLCIAAVLVGGGA